MSFRIVGCIPAGRRRYMELLIPHLLRQRAHLNEVQIWVNTLDQADREFISGLTHQYPQYFRLIEPTMVPRGNASICPFWRNATDPDTIYIRTDDDIVWMAPEAMANLVQYRRNNPRPFLIYGNIINNAICTHLHQRQGCIPLSAGIATYRAMCPTGWKSGSFAETVHRTFLQHLQAGNSRAYLFHRWVLWNYERVSINVCAWFGRDFHEHDSDHMKGNEERWVSCIRPLQLERPNEICGDALFSHFAFHPQRAYLESTDLLSKYRQFLPESDQMLRV